MPKPNVRGLHTDYIEEKLGRMQNALGLLKQASEANSPEGVILELNMLESLARSIEREAGVLKHRYELAPKGVW